MQLQDLWISKAKHDILTLVINFLGNDWQPRHITLCLFEPTYIIGQTLARKST
jgi:hypothetical protein